MSNASQLLKGSGESSSLFSRQKRKDIEFSAISLSAKKFPRSMVVLNYPHVSNILNSGFFFLIVLLTKCSVLGRRDPALWPATFQVSFIILTGLFGLQKILCLGMLLDHKI